MDRTTIGVSNRVVQIGVSAVWLVLTWAIFYSVRLLVALLARVQRLLTLQSPVRVVRFCPTSPSTTLGPKCRSA